MANVVTTTPPLDNNNEISSSSSANEQVINSPPHLNRLAGGNDINNGNSTEESSSETNGQPTPQKKKTVTKLLKESLASLDALIENNTIPDKNTAVVVIDNNNKINNSPNKNNNNNNSNHTHRDGYTRTTASWESRYIASHTEREYRRVQDEELKSSIKVAWVSPKSKKKINNRNRNNNNNNNSNNNTPNSSMILNNSFQSNASSYNSTNNNNINSPSRSSTHEHNVSATTLKSPRSSSSNHDIVTSTKSVNQSWGHKWGLRGASPTPRLDSNTVHTTHSAPKSSPTYSYKNHNQSSIFSPAFSNRIDGEKTSADIFVKDSKVNDHTKTWIEKRREMVKKEIEAKEEQKKLDAAFGFRSLANNTTGMSTYIPQVPARLDYNADFDIERIRKRTKELKNRQKAAIAAWQVAKETKEYEEKFAENEIELETLVHSLPKAYRKAVTKRILSRRRFLHENHISNNNNFSLRGGDGNRDFDMGYNNSNGKPPWSIPISPVKSPMLQKKSAFRRRKKKKKKGKKSNIKTTNSDDVPLFFQPEAFQKHLQKQEKAREYKKAAASVFHTGDTWTKSPTRTKPFKLTTSTRVNSIRIKNQKEKQTRKKVSALAKKKKTKKMTMKKKIMMTSSSSRTMQKKEQMIERKTTTITRKKKKKVKRKIIKKKKRNNYIENDIVIDTPIKSAASELLSMK